MPFYLDMKLLPTMGVVDRDALMGDLSDNLVIGDKAGIVCGGGFDFYGTGITTGTVFSSSSLKAYDDS